VRHESAPDVVVTTGKELEKVAGHTGFPTLLGEESRRQHGLGWRLEDPAFPAASAPPPPAGIA
jgi:hypothetical protein